MDKDLKIDDGHTIRAELINRELARIQNVLKAPKDLGGEVIRYKYRNCEQILELLKPHLNGLTIVVSDEMVSLGERYYVKATATLSDGVVAVFSSAWAREPENPTVMSQPQMSGAISSYARKYALCGLFAIDGGAEDPDSIDMNGNREPPKVPKMGGEPCTQQQKDDIVSLNGNYSKACDYFKTKELTKSQAIWLIDNLKKKAGNK
jgi:hypothetical protein